MQSTPYYLFLPSGEVFFNRGSAAGLYDRGCEGAVLRAEHKGNTVWYRWTPEEHSSPWDNLSRAPEGLHAFVAECEIKHLLIKELYEN